MLGAHSHSGHSAWLGPVIKRTDASLELCSLPISEYCWGGNVAPKPKVIQPLRSWPMLWEEWEGTIWWLYYGNVTAKMWRWLRNVSHLPKKRTSDLTNSSLVDYTWTIRPFSLVGCKCHSDSAPSIRLIRPYFHSDVYNGAYILSRFFLLYTLVVSSY